MAEIKAKTLDKENDTKKKGSEENGRGTEGSRNSSLDTVKEKKEG